MIFANLILLYVSLRADSTDSVKRSEVPPPVESVHQRHRACPKSHAVPRLEKANIIGGEISLLFSLSLIDRLTS